MPDTATTAAEPPTNPAAGRIDRVLDRVADGLERPVHGLGAVTGTVGERFGGWGRSRPLAAASGLLARRHGLIALIVYLAGVIVIEYHAVLHPGTEIAGNIVGDPTQYMWAMWWWPHAILGGLNPLVTHAIWVPDAYNLGSVTSTPVPALLLAPLNALIGWRAGPVVSYNLCMLIAPVLSAWLAYRLCLRVTGAPGASILGGWLYGFSAYFLSQLQGHLNLAFTFLPVALALLALARLNGDISRRRFVTLAAVALIAQIGIGTEIVFTTTCLGAVAVVTALLIAPPDARRRIVGRLVPELALAYLVAAVVCSPLLYYALIGPAVNPGYNSRLNVADLLSYVIPTPLFRVGQNRFLPIADLFPAAAGFTETGTYLGLPLLAGACAGAVAAWRHWGMRVLVLCAVVACVWSLGPTLIVAGQATLPLPWRLLDLKPAFDEISPVRIGLYVELAAAVACAVWLARPGRWRAWRWLLALLAVAFIAPNFNHTLPTGQPIFAENVSSPAFITDGLYRRELRHDEVILPIPFGPFGNSLLWQAQARGYFREASGWFGYYPDGYRSSLTVSELLSFHPFTDPYRHLRHFLGAHDVGAVVVLPAGAGPWPHVLTQLGLRRVETGGVWLYRVPVRLRLLRGGS